MGSKTVDKIAMFLAELLGTAMLIFLGCMGCLSWNGQPPSSLQSSFTFGMVVMLIIQTFGCVSGAHLNPVVTLAAIVYDMITVQVKITFISDNFKENFLQYWLMFRILSSDGLRVFCCTNVGRFHGLRIVDGHGELVALLNWHYSFEILKISFDFRLQPMYSVRLVPLVLVYALQRHTQICLRCKLSQWNIFQLQVC